MKILLKNIKKKKMASCLLDGKVTRHCNSVLKQKKIDDT